MHLLLLVYWLGADLGTFYASRFVANPALSPAARATAARIMLGIDIAPRLCMPLVLGSGVHLAALVGVLAPAMVVPAWGLALAWLAIKLLGFAATIACGLMIRVHLKPFGPAFARLMSGDGRVDNSADNNTIIAASIGRCVPYVLAIWAVLVLCAAAGLHLLP